MGNADGMSRRGNKSDYYETPWQCVQALIDEYPPRKNTRFLDPCCGNNKVIGNTLRANGYTNITEIDILFGTDFLEHEDYDVYEKPYDVIIANPPYSIKNQFIEKAIKVAYEVYFILPVNIVNYNEFQAKYLDIPNYRGRFLMRPKFFMEAETKDIPKRGGVSAYAWFNWEEFAPVLVNNSRGNYSFETYIDLDKYFNKEG